MEGDRPEPRKESSFEIITSSDDDDIVTAPVYSSGSQSASFESLNSLYFLESITRGVGKEKELKTNCNITEKQTRPDKLNKVELSSCLSVVPFEKSSNIQDEEFNQQKLSTVRYVDIVPSNEAIPSNSECQVKYTSKNIAVIKDSENIWASKKVDEGLSNQMKEEVNKYSRMEINDYSLSTKGCISNASDSTHETVQSISTNDTISLKPKNNDGNLCAAEKSEHSEAETRHHNRLLDGCSFVKCGLRMCRNVQNNKNLQNLASGIKSSFYKFLNTFELEINSALGMNDPLNIFITAGTSDSLIIEEAFYKSLSGQVIITKFSEVKDFKMPILPVGHKSALLVAQSKIRKARLLYDYKNNAIIVSTTTFIFEIYPQRWQQSTILCLEDPNFMLNLHNFTSTVPVPNEFVLQAQRLTPNDYPFDLGLAVTLDQAIGCTIDNKDLEETLCCVNHSVNLRSAAAILAGMYSKYVSRYVQ